VDAGAHTLRFLKSLRTPIPHYLTLLMANANRERDRRTAAVSGVTLALLVGWRQETDSGCKNMQLGRSKPGTELCNLNVGYAAPISMIAAAARGRSRPLERQAEGLLQAENSTGGCNASCDAKAVAKANKQR
jgi:hypothetical protein